MLNGLTISITLNRRAVAGCNTEHARCVKDILSYLNERVPVQFPSCLLSCEEASYFILGTLGGEKQPLGFKPELLKVQFREDCELPAAITQHSKND